MITNVSLTYSTPFRCKCICNGSVVGETFDNTHHFFNIPKLPQKVELVFEPFKIRPDLRLNKILVNTGVAGVNVYDHKYEITLRDDWLETYGASLLKSKQEYLIRQHLGDNANPDKIKKWFKEYNLGQEEKKFSSYKKELEMILNNLK